MSRRSARKNAFYLLFQMDFTPTEEYSEVKDIFFAEKEEKIEEEDKDFILELVDGTNDNIEQIDEIIGGNAKGWNTHRMSQIDLAILRLAVYELKYGEETPIGVVINEAVELAKKFSTDEAPAFINGILGKVAKD